MKAPFSIALAALVLYLSPGARSWLGGLLMLVGGDLCDSCPDVMTEEQKERVGGEIMQKVAFLDSHSAGELNKLLEELELERQRRNGGSP